MFCPDLLGELRALLYLLDVKRKEGSAFEKGHNKNSREGK